MADMMEALGTLATDILRERARRTRSVCVVALKLMLTSFHWRRIGGEIPKRIPNNQECDVDILRIVKDVITSTLYHFPVCKNHFPFIILLLLRISVSSEILAG
jgi:hypothetical protein